MTDTPTDTPTSETLTNDSADSRQSIESEVVLRFLEQATRPLTVSQLRQRLTGPLKLPLEKIEQILGSETETGRAFKYPAIGRGGQPRYSTRGPGPVAREAILGMTSSHPLSLMEIRGRMKVVLHGMSETARRLLLRKLIQEMLAEGHLYEWPPLLGKRAKIYGAQPPDPRTYVEDALRKIAKRLGRAPDELLPMTNGFSSHAVTGTAAPNGNTSLDEKLLERMLQVKLAAARGASLPLPELWHSLRSEGWDKETFDRIVLDLAKSYRVTLLRHDFTAVLSDRERADLVADQAGNYYVGIARR